MIPNDYFAVFALDIDGVFADTLHGFIRYDHPGAQDPRLTKFIEDHPEIMSTRKTGLGKRDVNGIMVESLILIAEFVQKSNSCMVLVSSWIHNVKTFEYIELLIQELTGIKYDKPFMVGQIKSGGGGTGRELAFFQWCRDNFDPTKVMSVSAIDDSGTKHFPFLGQLNQLIAPAGRCGFTPDNYIAACRKIDWHCEQWSDWLDTHGDKWVNCAGKPLLTREEFWNILHTSKDRDSIKMLIDKAISEKDHGTVST